MSDTSTQGAEGAVTDAGTDAGAGAGAETDPFEDASRDTFDRAYVEKLRSESAGYRTKAKEASEKLAEYEDVFAQIDPEDRKVWLDMARTMYEDPKAGADYLKRVAEHVQSGMTQEQAEVAAGNEPDGKDGEPKPLTQADFDRMYQERRQAEQATAQQEAAVKAITDEAAELGYKPETVDYDLLLGIAYKQTGGDLKAAHQVIVDSRQAVIDEYVAAKAADGGAAQAPAGGIPVATGGTQPIKNISDADRAAKARLASLAEAGAPINSSRRGRRG